MLSIVQMKHLFVLTLCLLAFCLPARAGFPSHRIEGYEMPTTGLYNVPIAYYRRPRSVDAEATWEQNLEALRDAVGKTSKLECPNPSYSFERDRINSISTGVL